MGSFISGKFDSLSKRWALLLIALVCSVAFGIGSQDDLRITNSLSLGPFAAPDASSILDIRSTTKGVLLPRMTNTQLVGISAPGEGLVGYDLTNHELSVYNGSGWQKMFDAANLTGTLPAGSIPPPAIAGLGGVFSHAAVTHNFLTSINTDGTVTGAQPACGDLSNAAASCSTDATNASNISTGTLAAGRLPNPSSSSLGGVQSAAAVSHQWINSISTSGVPALSQPAFTDISGTAQVGQGGTGVTSVTVAPAATAFAGWDANKNLSANNLIDGYATTATAAGTTTLTVASPYQQYFTGSTTQTVLLPVTSTLALGQQFSIVNNSSGVVTVESSGANTLQAMAANTSLVATVVSTSGTGTASWSWSYVPQTSGTVSSVAMTVPSFLSISGSPITTSGTLALTLSGTALPLADGGTGQTTQQAAMDALSPCSTAGCMIQYGSSHNNALTTSIGQTGYFLTSGGTSVPNFWGNDGSTLTNLNATNLLLGTVPAGRMPGTLNAGVTISDTTADSPTDKEMLLLSRSGGSSSSGVGNRSSWITLKDASNPTYLGGFACFREAPNTNFKSKCSLYANATGGAVTTFTSLSRVITMLDTGLLQLPSYTAGALATDGSGNMTAGTLAFGNGGTGQSSYTDGQLLIGNSSTGGVSKAALTAGSNITITNGNGTISIAASAAAAASWNYTSQTTTYTAIVNDWVFASSASFAITLPTAVGNGGKSIILQHAGTSLTSVYAVTPHTGESIGSLSANTVFNLYTNGEVLFLMSDGTNWQIVGHPAQTGWVDGGAVAVTATSAYTFTISSASVTLGAVYSNNGHNFVMTKTISSALSITAGGDGAPAASGTLTKVSGTGASTLTFSSVASSVPVKGTTAEHFWWRRNQQNAEVRWELTQTVAGTNGTGDYLWTFLTNLLPDTSLMTPYLTAVSGQNTALFGMTGGLGNFYSTGGTSATTIAGQVLVYDSNHFRLGGIFANGSGIGEPGNIVGTVSGQGGFSTNTTYAIMATFSYPVVGWQP